MYKYGRTQFAVIIRALDTMRSSVRRQHDISLINEAFETIFGFYFYDDDDERQPRNSE